ncbi:MAG: hypothetical protein WCQ96_01095 [Patescibacteria group bacterium]
MIDSNFTYNTKALSSCAKESSKWLSTHKDLHNKLNSSLLGFSEEQFVVPLILDNKYGFLPPWSYCLHEAGQELNSAITLVLSGMYKESFRSLRSFVELNLMSIYYFTNEDIESFLRWISGDERTPTRKFLVDYLLKNNPKIALLESQLLWSQRIGEFYNSLSVYVHTQGSSGSFRSLRNSNTITFSQRGLELGIKSIIEAIQLVSEAFVANFPMALQPLPLFEKFAFSPPAGDFLDEFQVEHVNKIFPARYRKILKNMSDNNDKVKFHIDWVLSMSNLSQEETMQSLEKTLDSFPEQREEVHALIKEGKTELAFALTTAIQRSFLSASLPLLNEHYLRIFSSDKTGSSSQTV